MKWRARQGCNSQGGTRPKFGYAPRFAVNRLCETCPTLANHNGPMQPATAIASGAYRETGSD